MGSHPLTAQVEEAVALRAIFGDSFTLVAGLSPRALDCETPDPGELAAEGPVHGRRLECQLQVFVDVSTGYRLQVRPLDGTMWQKLCMTLGFSRRSMHRETASSK